MKSSHGRGSGNRSDGGRQDGGRSGFGHQGGGHQGGGQRHGSGGSHHGGSHHGGSHHGGGRHGERGPNSRNPNDRQQQRAISQGAPQAQDDGRLHLAPRPDQRHPPRPQEQRPRGNPHDTPRGTVWLYGVHAVAAALANPARRLRRLLLTEEAEATLSHHAKQPWPLGPERVERGRLDHLLGRDTAHQGMALLADLLTPPALAQALEREGPILVLDQVTDPRNVGAILRSAAAFGAAAVIVQDRNAPEETGALAKAASGALEKVPLFRAVNISRTIVALKAAGVWCIGLDASATTLSRASLGDRRIALVLGAEGEGLRRLTRETCDEVAGLAVPRGHESAMESLNVSAAAAIALYEVRRPL